MLSVIQRVRSAHVEIGGCVTARIGHGLLALVCVERGDTQENADRLLFKILRLRIFGDTRGRMNCGLADVGGGLLLVSQFTLAADTSGGNRPGFSAAAPPDEARALYDYMVEQARAQYSNVQQGVFAADMQIHLINDGPVTIPMKV